HPAPKSWRYYTRPHGPRVGTAQLLTPAVRSLSLENVEVEELRAVDHPDDDHPGPHDPEDRAVRCVDEMPVLDLELGRLRDDRTPPRPLLEACDVSLHAVEPRRGSRRIVLRDVGVDRRNVALGRPCDVNAISSRHDGGL